MEKIKGFRTKTGYCNVLPDKIILIREGIRGKIADVLIGESKFKVLLIYAVVSLFFFYLGFMYYNLEQIFRAILSSIVGVVFAYNLINNLIISETPIIERRHIERVEFHNGFPYLTRDYFEVFFRTKQGKKRKRVIGLPGPYRKGKEESKIALNIMRSEKLI